jgi:hypothetical protein
MRFLRGSCWQYRYHVNAKSTVRPGVTTGYRRLVVCTPLRSPHAATSGSEVRAREVEKGQTPLVSCVVTSIFISHELHWPRQTDTVPDHSFLSTPGQQLNLFSVPRSALAISSTNVSDRRACLSSLPPHSCALGAYRGTLPGNLLYKLGHKFIEICWLARNSNPDLVSCRWRR